jgi:chromosome segregation ATPase
MSSINPRLNVNSLDIRNKNLSGPLNLKGFNNLRKLDLSGTRITSLDLENYSNLRVIHCDNNPLLTSLRFMSAIEIHLSQDELIKTKEALENRVELLLKKINDLEKEKNFLDEQIVELKNASERDKSSFRKQIDEIKEKNGEQIKDLENSYRVRIGKLETKHNEEVRQNKKEFEAKLNQEYNKVNSLTNNKNFLEERLKGQGNELQRLSQSLSISENQVKSLKKNLNIKKEELASTLLTSRLEAEQRDEIISSLKKENSFLQEEIVELNNQLKKSKMKRLEGQKSELAGLVANVGSKLGTSWQDKLDDLIGGHEELNKNSSSFYVKKQFEKVKEELIGRLGEEKIADILARQEQI